MTEDGTRHVVRFSAGGSEFAVDVTQAVEVVGADRIVALPDPAPGVVGIVERDGVTLPVVTRLGAATGPDSRHVLIVDTGSSLLGLLVDEVRAVTSLPSHALNPAPPGQRHPVVEAIIVEPDGVAMLIDPRALTP